MSLVEAYKEASSALLSTEELRERSTKLRETLGRREKITSRSRVKVREVNPKVCRYELNVIEPYLGPPCRKANWSKRGCEIHGECVRVSGTSVHSCDRCEEYSPNLGPWKSISKGRAKEFRKQLQVAAGQYVKTIGEPISTRPRGIIVSGGGKYLPSAYITIRAIRNQDSETPVELWYYGDEGEGSTVYERILAPFNVRFVDANKVAEYRYLHKYAIKSFAVRHCDFEEVLHLDSDSYPVDDLNKLWGKYSANFYPDIPLADNWIDWDAFGVKPRFPIAWETGQYLLNRRVHWDVLNLAYFYDQHSEYTWNYGWGDTGTWRAAWSYFDKSPTIFAERPEWVGSAYLQMGPDGKTPMFVHRCRDKFRVNNSHFYTGQHHREPTFDERFPLEKECFEWLEELKGKL